MTDATTDADVAGPPTRGSVRLDAAEITRFLDQVFPGATDHFVIESVGPMEARVRLQVDESRLRPGGTVSGPSLMTLADTAVWVALLAMVGPEPLTVTSNLGIDFLRKPGPDADVVAETRLLKLGRRLAVGDVVMRSEGDDRPVARANVTYAIPSSYHERGGE